MKRLPSILIVEDEPAIAELIVTNLRYNGFNPVWVNDFQGAICEISEFTPGLILMDWMLPGGSGLLLTKRLREESKTKSIPIIMLTARSAEDDRILGLNSGADDYITKPFSINELIARIRALLRRTSVELANEILSVGNLILDLSTYRVAFLGQQIKLSTMDFKVLQHLMRYPERVHTRAQILDHVWGDQGSIEDRTIDVHIKRLRSAMGNAGNMIETVRGAGYRITQSLSE